MENRWTVKGSGCFKYFKSQVEADGACETDLARRINEGNRACMGSAEKYAEE